MTEKDNPMMDNLAPARAREAALKWLAGHDPDGDGPIGDQAGDCLCHSSVVLDAFSAGAVWQAARLADAIKDSVLIEEGGGWLKVHGLPNATPLFDVLADAKTQAVAVPCPHERTIEQQTGDGTPVTFCGECGRNIVVDGVDLTDIPESGGEWFDKAQWRTDGVADLGVFRATTCDPRFDPAKPATINGFLYYPAKEN